MKRMLLVIALVAGCHSRRATQADCEQILDRIVDLELRERGFHDPVLLERKRTELHRALAPELSQCYGRRLSDHALGCVATAETTEQVTHVCLR
jgi:N-acetylglutamate synthase-like GNAT family acetyltransferase